MSLAALGAVVPDQAIRFLGHDTHEHEVPHLIHVVTGEARIVADGQPVVLKKKESLWLAPYVPHSTTMLADGFALGPMLAEQAIPPERVRKLGVVPAIVEIMTAALGAAPATAGEVEPFRCALSEALVDIGRQHFALVLPVHPAARAVAQDALRSGVSLAELARRHHLSERQLQRIFAEQTGLGFARWRTRVRLNAAITQLRGGASWSTAVAASGFTSRSGLLKALVRETGVPASVWQRNPRTALAHGPR